MRHCVAILLAALLVIGCKQNHLTDNDRAAIQAVVEQQEYLGGPIEEIYREPNGGWRVSTTKGGLYGVTKTNNEWKVIQRGVWIK